MNNKTTEISSEELKDIIVAGMQEKKAEDIVVLDLRKLPNAVSDFFVLSSGNSDTQVGAIADSVEEEVYKTIGQNPWNFEGKKEQEWVLIDYVDVVAHVFRWSKREFYNLENVWGDAVVTKINEEINS